MKDSFKFLLLGVCVMLSSCKKEAEVQHPFNLSNEDYKVVMDKSLITTGNNARLKNVIKKLEKGEEVYICCLGGSVTEGAGIKDDSGKELWEKGYAYKFADALKAKYPKKNGENIHFNGAGLSGTPSTLGLVRYESDVVEVLGHIPDLLVIEFAVNDDGSNFCQRGFEGLIRKALLASEDTAVIALYSDAKTYKNSQPSKMPIANLYRLPQVSIQDAVESSGIAISEEEFFDDYVHPKEPGHQLMADALMNLINKVSAEKLSDKYEIPQEPYNKRPLDKIVRITGDDENVKITAGSFSKTDSSCQSIKKTGKSNFPQNWHKTDSAANENFVMDINCRSLIFVYKVQGSWLKEKFGKAEIYIDGNKTEFVLDGGKDGGWCNCETVLLLDDSTAAEHKVEVKMAPGDESKGFTIVAMSYVK